LFGFWSCDSDLGPLLSLFFLSPFAGCFVLMELVRVSSKYIDERRYQIPTLGIPLESNILSGVVESYSAIADEWGWNVSSKVQMAQRNYENTELTY